MIQQKIYRLKKRIILLFISFFSVFLIGCWDQQPIGQIKIDLVMGMDLSPQKRLLVTRSSPIYEEEIKEKAEIISEEVDSPGESRKKTGSISYNRVVSGKIQQILFSKELAEKGIADLIETGQRDTENSNLAFIIIVDGSTKELIEKANELKDKPAPGFYLKKLIENGIKFSIIPETRLQNFCIACFTPGLDPIAPRIKLSSDESAGIKILGSALFAKDRLVGEIDINDTAALQAMMGKIRTSRYVFDTLKPNGTQNLPKRGSEFSMNHVKRKIKVTIKNGIPRVDIFLGIKGNVQEYRWNGIKDKKDKEELEEIISEEFAGICKRVLKYTQEVGSDPIGIGIMLRAKQGRSWKEEDWMKNYKRAVFNVEVKYTIVHYGVVR